MVSLEDIYRHKKVDCSVIQFSNRPDFRFQKSDWTNNSFCHIGIFFPLRIFVWYDIELQAFLSGRYLGTRHKNPFDKYLKAHTQGILETPEPRTHHHTFDTSEAHVVTWRNKTVKNHIHFPGKFQFYSQHPDEGMTIRMHTKRKQTKTPVFFLEALLVGENSWVDVLIKKAMIPGILSQIVCAQATFMTRQAKGPTIHCN